MALYRACGLKPIRKMEVLLDALFKNLVLCILRREMSVMVVINNVWNVKGDKKIFGITLYSGFSIVFRD